MPITNAIPMPESGADAFMSGASQTQNMINGMMNNKYNQGTLKVQQAAQSRAQELLPYLMQKYQDAHGKASSEQYMQDMYDTITQYEIKKARPNLFGGERSPSYSGESRMQQQGQAPIVKINSSAPFNFSGEVTQQGNAAPRMMPEKNRQALIQALNNPNISPQDKQGISDFLMANPSAAQSNVTPAAINPTRQLSQENQEKLEQFIASGQASPEDTQQIKQFLNSSQSAIPNDMNNNPNDMPQNNNAVPQNQGQAQQPIAQDQNAPVTAPGGIAPSGNQPSQMYDNQNNSTNAAGSYSDASGDYAISPERVIAPGTKGNEWKDELAGVGKFPDVETKPDFKNGLIFRKYPSGRQTIQKMTLPAGESIEDKARQKQTGTATGKLIGDLESSVVAAGRSGETLDNIGKILVNPVWKDMRENPLFEGKQLDYFYSKSGTPEQQRLAGNFLAYTGQVVADMAGQFKGPFRVGEQHLIDSMKVNKNDTMQAAKGKVEALMNMHEMMVKRATIEANLMRRGVKPADAARQANSQVNSELVKKIIQNKLGIDTDKIDEKKSAEKAKAGDDRVQKGESRQEPTFVMYKDNNRYEFPEKYRNSPKLKDYTNAPT